MIKVEDQILVGEEWFFVMIEIFPCRSHWNRSHRWFAEVAARKTDWPEEDREPYIWNHYWMHDYSTWTLRGAWFKAHKMVWKLQDYIEQNPDDKPTN